MVLSATNLHRKLVGYSQARSGFSCVENDSVCTRHCIDKPARERGNARHPAEKIQRSAFACEQRACWTSNFGQHRFVLDVAAIVDLLSECGPLIKFEPDGLGDLQTGHYTFLFGDDAASQRRVGRNNAVGGYVAAADVLRERPPDAVGDFNRE